MLQLKINKDGKWIAFDFPEYPHEVSLSAFIDYEKAMSALNEWRKENENENFASFKYRAGELKHVVACIAAFVGRDVSKSPMNKFRFSAKDGISDEVETNIFAVFNLAAVCMSKYKESEYIGDYWFSYKGERYYLPFSYVNEMTKAVRYEDVTAAQSIEALEAWRLFEIVQSSDADGGYWFKTILNIIACMARKKDDPEFPSSESEIQRYLSERILHFKDIDMQSGLDVYNFFFGTLHPFAPTPITLFSSSPQSDPRQRAKRRQSSDDSAG
jgi:hypothetical protein